MELEIIYEGHKATVKGRFDDPIIVQVLKVAKEGKVVSFDRFYFYMLADMELNVNERSIITMEQVKSYPAVDVVDILLPRGFEIRKLDDVHQYYSRQQGS